MKYCVCFQLGFRNFIKHRRVYANLCLVFFLISLMSITLVSYRRILTRTIHRYQKANYSENMITFRINDSNELSGILSNTASLKDISAITIECLYNSEESSYIGTDNTQIIINGKKYVSQEQSKLVKDTQFIKLNYISSMGDFIPWNDKIEFEYTYPDERMLISGDFPYESNQLVLTNTLLQRYGITSDMYQDMIGKTICFYAEGKDICKNPTTYRISGIINADYFKLKAHTISSINTENVQIMVNSSGDSSILRIYVKDCYELIQGKIQLEGLLNQSGSCNTFYYNNINILLIQEKIIDTILTLIVFVLCITGIAYVMITYIYYFHEHHDFIKMMNTLGMSFQNIRVILITELSLAGMSGLFLGLLCSIKMIQWIISTVSNFSDVNYSVTFSSYVQALVIALLIIESVIILITYKSIKSLKNEKLV